jgi:hypothetical protein
MADVVPKRRNSMGHGSAASSKLAAFGVTHSGSKNPIAKILQNM